MQTTPRSYTEHSHTEAHGFDITDATLEAPHGDLIWIGFRGDGRWLSAKDALEFSAAVKRAAHEQTERLAQQAAKTFHGMSASPRRMRVSEAREDYDWRNHGFQCGDHMDAPERLPRGAHWSFDAGDGFMASGSVARGAA